MKATTKSILDDEEQEREKERKKEEASLMAR
jgi:hypothetical protein